MIEIPAVQFASARGGRLAYQRWGTGDQTIVAIPPAAQNVEASWERAEIRSMLERFGTFADYVHFDKRGTGSSDYASAVPGLDERVDDLRAVMDDAGIERAHLFAQSEGGPMTLLFAAAYPHRVESLILVGSGARIAPSDLTAEDRAAQVAVRSDFAAKWGTDESRALELFAPSKVNDPEFRAWHTRYERASASSDSLRDLLIQMLDMDVTEVLADIDAPALVISRTDDPAMPLEFGRELAEGLRNSTFVEVEGSDHFCYLGDVDAWMNRVEEWVTGEVQEHPAAAVAPEGAHVVTLGRFAVVVGGVEVPTSEWGSRRARTLLKRLVAARGWPVTRDELTELLWPDDDDMERLGARLSVQLSAVRRVLGGGVIADRQTVALDRSAVSTDLDAFLDAPDDDAIVAGYAGEFLPEDRYDDWSAAVRDQARSHFGPVTGRRGLAAGRAVGPPARGGRPLRRRGPSVADRSARSPR
jgi:pimeloyl-ACP methyl ester carboxylesterase